MSNNKQNFFNDVIEGLKQAIDDVRQKVVEEPWYGQNFGDVFSPAPKEQTAITSQTIAPVETGQSFHEYCAKQQGQTVEEYDRAKAIEQEQAQALELQKAQEQGIDR